MAYAHRVVKNVMCLFCPAAPTIAFFQQIRVTTRRGMEDAIVLAQCLRDIPEGDPAFAMYERLRRERVERVVQYARSLGSWRAMTSPIQVWFWELLMPFFLKRSANPTALDWLYSYQVDWDAPVGKTPDPTERESAAKEKQFGQLEKR